MNAKPWAWHLHGTLVARPESSKGVALCDNPLHARRRTPGVSHRHWLLDNQ